MTRSACFGQIVHEGSSSIHQQAVGIAAMEIDLSHLPSLAKSCNADWLPVGASIGNSGCHPKERYGGE
jgi:hypothetical protein